MVGAMAVVAADGPARRGRSGRRRSGRRRSGRPEQRGEDLELGDRRRELGRGPCPTWSTPGELGSTRRRVLGAGRRALDVGRHVPDVRRLGATPRFMQRRAALPIEDDLVDAGDLGGVACRGSRHRAHARPAARRIPADVREPVPERTDRCEEPIALVDTTSARSPPRPSALASPRPRTSSSTRSPPRPSSPASCSWSSSTTALPPRRRAARRRPRRRRRPRAARRRPARPPRTLADSEARDVASADVDVDVEHDLVAGVELGASRPGTGGSAARTAAAGGDAGVRA